MRLLLLLAVIALVVDAVNHDGAYTKSAFRYLTVATEQLTGRLGGTEHAGRSGTDRARSGDITHL